MAICRTQIYFNFGTFVILYNGPCPTVYSISLRFRSTVSRPQRFVAAKPYTPCPFWKKNHCFFSSHFRRKLQQRKKKINLYLLSLYLSFWEFSPWNVKKKQYKREKIGFFFKRGGGRALRLQAPVVSTMYIFYRYPLPDIKGWQVRKRVFLVTFCILI